MKFQPKKNQSELDYIKEPMMDSLEEVDEKGILRGDYVCHEDIPEETPDGFDTHFAVCGEDPDITYLVCILKVTM